MPNDLISPLAAILAEAAKLPAKTGITALKAQEIDARAKRLNSGGSNTVILADVSGSMSDRAGSRTKIELLREALATVGPQIPNARLVAFHSMPAECFAGTLPEPQGSTALDLAIDYAASLDSRTTLVISDGQPDSEADALKAAERLKGVIDVLYIGDDGNTKAIEFMRRLARIGAGRVIVRDIKRYAASTQIVIGMREILALPEPKL